MPWWFWPLGLIGVALIVAPVAGLVARSSATALLDAARSPAGRTALALSLEVATLAALVAVAFGAPLGWVLARSSFPGRAIVRSVAILPLVLPPVVGGVGLLAAFGRRTPLGKLLATAGVSLPFTTVGAVLAAAFVAMPLVILAVEAGVRSIDPRIERTAATLGASPTAIARQVTLPSLLPQLAAGAALAWARGLGEFGATITFAGNLRGRTQTLPLAVFETLQTDPDAAIALSLVLVGVSLVVLVALRGRVMPR